MTDRNAFALALADRLDPIPVEPRAELADPVTLATYLDPGYVDRPHLRVIAAELRALHASAEEGEPQPRLMINTPPQIGKSRTAVEWGAFWWLCLHPTTSVAICCYDEDLAEDRGGAVRRLVELYGSRYGVHLRRGSAGLKDWTLTKGGSVRSVGIGSGITGHDADLIFIDDPIKSRADADSERKRKQTYDWYTNDVLTRLSPGAPLIFIQTPWAKGDIRDRILTQEGERWRKVVMPAFATAADDPLGRAPGEPITHPKLPIGDAAALRRHWEAVRATVGAFVFSALYQCDPKPREGVLIDEATLIARRSYEFGKRGVPDAKTKVVGVDPSGGGRDTAGVLAGFLGVDGRLYFTHDRSGVMASDAWSRAACKLAVETEADRIIVEVNYGGDQATLAIRTAWKSLQLEEPETFAGSMCPRIVPVRAKRGKLLRAEPIAQQWIEDRINTAAYLPELEAEWLDWTESGESPGRIDTSVYIAYAVLPVPNVHKPATGAGAQALAAASLISWGRSG